ncbi:MAG: hypothetical protein PVJ80_17765 [Gemmatimonadota bacterium]|jgi:hypothetical protein
MFRRITFIVALAIIPALGACDTRSIIGPDSPALPLVLGSGAPIPTDASEQRASQGVPQLSPDQRQVSRPVAR